MKNRVYPVRCRLVAAMLSLVVLSSSLSAVSAATPEWIWLTKEAGEKDLTHYRKVFELSAKPKTATLTAACDNNVAVFINGEMVVQHDGWERPLVENVAAKLKPGKNVLALRCNNSGGPAGLIAKLKVEMEDGKKLEIVTDASWLAMREPAENWRIVEYDEKGWTPAVSLGQLGVKPWGNVSLDGSPDFVSATPIEDIVVPPDFKVELLYSVPKEKEGSWVSMTPDPKGRLICSDQYGGLYRVTPGADAESTKIEKLDVAIGEAQGLLYAFDGLYVVVNGKAAQGSGLYRVTDTNGDDQFDDVKLIKSFSGAGEHGPHAVRLGPDGLLYVIAGNHTKLPEGLEPTSPHRNWDEDHLLPRNPDGRGHATGVMAPGGWVVRTDKDGQKWEVFCAGFRNQYDIDFNQDGELFSYDADMEWDTGTPWYRPTRVNHAVSAAEFGWRYGTGKWPAYYVDSLGAVVDIGLGSPTGIQFGTGTKFPAKYQRALFINDWTYGKIYAVHMTPKGSSYVGDFETFISGRPLPVTDITVNRIDGALYFTIGGRRTQSGLYRVTYVGKESTDPVGSVEDAKGVAARAERKKLEAFHGRVDAAAVKTAWPYLSSTDRNLRYAARVAIENQPVDTWISEALAETRPAAVIQLMVALARTGKPEVQSQVLAALNKLPLEKMSEENVLDALRAYELAFIRLGGKQASAADVIARLSPLYPSQSELVNRELCQVLVYLEAPNVVPRTMELLTQAQTQQDQLHFVFVLRNAKEGWTPELRQAYFSWMNLAESKYKGGASFQLFVQKIRQDAVEKLTEAEKTALKEVIEGKQNVEAVKLETTRQFVHNWQMDDLLPMIDQVGTGRSFASGKAAYEATQCAKCHRFAGDGASTGPDITGVGNRFTPIYLLESFLTPSKVVSDQYRNTIIQTDDGNVLQGRVVEEDDKVVRIRTSPFATALTEIPKSSIEEQQFSTASEMPNGLVNVLTKEEILDLIAYLRSAGNPDDKAFKKP